MKKMASFGLDHWSVGLTPNNVILYMIRALAQQVIGSL
ncbi:unnamed protein product [Allacma fusca]|uniref:Uncharacterized protein n=1 Tax=Allacma fusca TaxID=39272 RepID=A0A8J2JFW7_9HEXA|nr:unnamed protein product [Allacma fusca]